MLTASVSPAAHLLPRLLLLLLGDREHRDFGHRLLFLLLGDGDHCDVVVMLSFLTGAVIPSSSSHHIAHLSLPRSIGCVALSFLVRSFVRPSVRPAMVTSDQISTFFNMYRHKSLVLTQFHLILSSTN